MTIKDKRTAWKGAAIFAAGLLLAGYGAHNHNIGSGIASAILISVGLLVIALACADEMDDEDIEGDL